MPRVQLIITVLFPLLIGGCAALGLSRAAPTRAESLRRMDPTLIQADTMGFADRFVTTMTGVYDDLEQRAPTSAAKDAAHQLKTDLALGAISNAVNSRPIAGLMDMVVLVTLLRQISEDSWTSQTFGPASVELTESLKRQEQDIRSLASRYFTDPQLQELGELAAQWHQAHPGERAVSHVHLADLPEANRPPEVHKKNSSVFALLFFDPSPDLDPAVREIQLSRATSERVFFYVQRLPLLLQLQTESFYRQMLDAPESRQLLSDVSAVAGSTTRFAETSASFTDSVSTLPEQLSAERGQALQQLTLEFQRQRDATVQQSAAALRQEQQNFVLNLEAATDRSINRVFTYLAVGALAVVALVTGTMVCHRRLWPGAPSAGAMRNSRDRGAIA
jgi:hypothetical protein